MKSLPLLLLLLAATPALADSPADPIVANKFEYSAKAFDKRVADDDWDQAARAADAMEAAIKDVQKADPKYNVAPLTTRVAAARAKVEAHLAQAKAAGERGKLAVAMERDHGDALEMARQIDQTGTSIVKLADTAAAFKGLAEVAQICKDNQLDARPSCKLAAQREALAKRMLETELPRAVTEEAKKIKGSQAAIATDGTITATSAAYLDGAALVAAWQARFAGLAEAASTPIAAERLAPIAEAATAFAAELPKAQKVSRLPKGMAAAAATVVADTKATYKDANVLKVLVEGRWDVKLDELKHPVERTAHGAALLQHQGEPFCRLVLFLAVARYEKGAYGPLHVDTFHPEFQVGACK